MGSPEKGTVSRVWDGASCRRPMGEAMTRHYNLREEQKLKQKAEKGNQGIDSMSK